ncbi:sigma-54 interaction domain-containing protein [Candidatus Nitrospira allomarina]|uniref:Sigma 54-interacting transcriptional regulator n=1 Tax=Candidatus Nitrospira allomarina TaxID=3020900 RepID=A0AA96JTT3_9BACT|nr:sigma 54-interacting transcriptional regulator [Candidatus Nitrospira allomarina]WNM59923.1 sigma 54-interacting transcriptional regulator [Candidatus Nitrospira allomarina]
MPGSHHNPLANLNEETALRTILEGTATVTGERFFEALVENLAKALHTHAAWVTEYFPDSRRMKALAFYLDGSFLKNWEMNITGTPCEHVIEQARLIHFPDNLLNLFPIDPEIIGMKAASYMGLPLVDSIGTILGHLAVMDTRPMPAEPRVQTIVRIFASRASAELQRIQAESATREREQKLRRLVDSAMDAIIELDEDLRVTRINPAAEKVFQCKAAQLFGKHFSHSLAQKDSEKLRLLIQDLNTKPAGQRSLWITGGFKALRPDGSEFPAEATLSQFHIEGRVYYTLILRNVNERLEAEQKIRALTIEKEFLKEELHELQHFGEILGNSPALVHVIRDIQQVADTEATVLITGETGTGKEVMARAIHANSRRRDHPFIKVNCAAIPATLIESEFFGHEQGAFTGATKKREGRFSLADGGTIFLDEIGELPLDLQGKLLRVLQEGEFEPVGSSHTKKVKVRILAATNRDLQKEAQEGRFREDLYYRLNVFPIHLPPLRTRGEDVVLLAASFVQHFAHRMGRTVAPLSPDALGRLRAYHWPGNVRELQNVIERAVITSQNGQLNLDRALPEAKGNSNSTHESLKQESPTCIRTIQEIQDFERQNILLALEQRGWKVSGEKGAAKLLGMNASTLASRIRALGIIRAK